MIRLILVFLVLFLVWVLFLADLTKQRKILISIATLLIAALALWFEGYGDSLREDIVSPQSVLVCGITAQHSYRSNFDVSLCVQNTATQGTVQRLQFAVLAARCDDADSCTTIERVERDVPVLLAAGEQRQIEQNLSFENVSQQAKDIQWMAEIIAVKATR